MVRRGLGALLQPLADRRAEIEALGALGHLGLAQSRYTDAARYFQRALALAEAVFDREAAIAACEGLGDATFAQGQASGARAWYARGLRVAEASTDRLLSGRLERRLGALATTQGDFSAATDDLSRARARFESDGPSVEMARVLVEQGRLDARLGRPAAAAASFQEALAWVRSPPPDVPMEIAIRLEIATSSRSPSRWLDAEEALRDAEQAALVAKRWRDLVRIYMLLGKLRGGQLDETGFVFFEQALEVCHVLQAASPIEAEVHLEYGVFRRRLGPADEARAHLERARDLFQLTGEAPARDRAEGELRQLSGVSSPKHRAWSQSGRRGTWRRRSGAPRSLRQFGRPGEEILGRRRGRRSPKVYLADLLLRRPGEQACSARAARIRAAPGEYGEDADHR